jgi:signal transduction histidine kinase
VLRSKVAVFVELAQKTAEVRRVGEVLRENEAREHTRQLLEREKEAAVMQQRWLEAILDTLPTPLILVKPGSPVPSFANRAAHLLAGGVFVGDASPRGLKLLDEAGRPLAETELPLHRAARGETLEGELVSFETDDGRGSVVAFSSVLPALYGNTETVLVNLHDVSVLKRAERTLMEAVAAREDFIAVGSHELRTPITALKFQVRNAIKSWERPAALADPAGHALEYLRQIQRSIDRLARLAEYLLDVSRLSSPGFQLAPSRFALEELVREVAQRPVEGPMAITVHADGDTTGVWDRARLEQVLDNLLDNARRYAAGPVELSVRGVVDQVTLEVRDHGPGIAPDELPRLFERFARGRAHDADQRGFGLGLWIVSQLAAHHGGSVRAESTPGEGACFIVSLPREAPPARVDA